MLRGVSLELKHYKNGSGVLHGFALVVYTQMEAHKET